MSERACGDCGECCFALKISELNKPKYSSCKNYCGGCQIYEDPSRPKACAEWNCIWIRGALSNSCRPDKTKLLLWLPDAATSTAWSGTLLMAMETAPGSSRTLKNQKSIRRLFRSGKNLMVIKFDECRELYLHRRFLAKVMAECSKKGVDVKKNGNVLMFTSEQAEKIWRSE